MGSGRIQIASIVIAAFLVSASPGLAQGHGLAMHGEPKYPADFTHLDYVNPEAPKGGVLRQAATGSYDSLNAFAVRGRRAQGLHLITDRLMARVWDEPFSMYGLVADRVDMPEDRSWIEVHLRPEARFHDGRPITVEDVVFTWELLRDRGRPNARRTYGKVTSAVQTGERSVRFDFAPDHDRELALIMAMLPVLPKHYWQDRDFDETTLEPPLGSGPYRIAEVDPGRSITYERVEDYWAANLPVNRGSYNFDRVIWDYYRDGTAAFEAFKAGAYNFRREWDVTSWLTGYDFPAAEDGRVILDVLPHHRPEWARALIYNTRRAPFDDRLVRQALTYALDFEWINRTLFGGVYKRINSYYVNSELAASGEPGPLELAVLDPWRGTVPDTVFGPAFEPPRTDGSGPRGLRRNLRQATALLEEAGFSVKDGVMVDADTGMPLQFEILLGSPSEERLALEFTRALERIGVIATIRTVERSQYQERLNDFDYDMTLNRWISTLSPGSEQLSYWGSEAADQAGSRNYAGIKNPAIDAVAGSIAEAIDREALVARTRALDRLLTWGSYSIPLYYLGNDRVAYWNDIARPDTTPLFGMVIETWWSLK